ncbi:MAG: HNH endonuclease [Deltaproteobacteria bacterium]|nr:HNH endonuclease [Deltaproteobacteria bacterium]
MSDVLTTAVLVLNRHFQPVQVTSARRAFSLLFRGAAWAIDESGESLDFWSWARLPARKGDDLVPTVSLVLRVPRVLRVAHYDRVPRTIIHLSHRNVMLRDQFQCQYCGRTPAPSELNIDHVVPRSQGGEDSWENLVTACRPCNLKKGGRTPDQSGMHLIRPAARPRWSIVREIMLDGAGRYKEWEPFLKVG